MDKFTYLGSSVSSNEKDINTWLAKAWTAIDWQSVIWKSGLTDKIKRSFFQAAVVSILLFGCNTWTLTKPMEKKLVGNYTRMLQTILKKSWKQHPKNSSYTGNYYPSRKVSKLDEPDIRDTAGEVRTSSLAIYSCGPIHMDEQSQDDQQEPIYNSSILIQDVAWKTSRKRRTIEMGSKRGSGRSMQAARHDDDDDDDFPIWEKTMQNKQNTTLLLVVLLAVTWGGGPCILRYPISAVTWGGVPCILRHPISAVTWGRSMYIETPCNEAQKGDAIL